MKHKEATWAEEANKAAFVTKSEPDLSDDDSKDDKKPTPEMLAEEREFLQKVHQMEAKNQEE